MQTLSWLQRAPPLPQLLLWRKRPALYWWMLWAPAQTRCTFTFTIVYCWPRSRPFIHRNMLKKKPHWTHLTVKCCWNAQYWTEGHDDQGELPAFSKANDEGGKEGAELLDQHSQLVSNSLLDLIDITNKWKGSHEWLLNHHNIYVNKVKFIIFLSVLLECDYRI